MLTNALELGLGAVLKSVGNENKVESIFFLKKGDYSHFQVTRWFCFFFTTALLPSGLCGRSSVPDMAGVHHTGPSP